MSDKQPEALRLAEITQFRVYPRHPDHDEQVATELRRLHAIEVLAHVSKAGHEQMFAECQRLNALCEEQKRLLEHAREHVIPSELWSEITKHLRQHEGAKHD